MIPSGKTAYIALGSNLPSRFGGPEENLREAIARLRELGRMMAISSFYETAPIGDQDQPVFLNAAIALETQLSPADLLARMLAIEREFGRERNAARPKGPRTLDLDLLLMEDCIVSEPGFTLPHPALARRRFVLAPLAEIAPAFRHPVLGHSVAELLKQLPDEGENRIAGVRKIGIRDRKQGSGIRDQGSDRTRF